MKTPSIFTMVILKTIKDRILIGCGDENILTLITKYGVGLAI